MESQNNVIKGDICYSESQSALHLAANSYLVCLDGRSAGVFPRIPEQYAHLPLADYTGKLVLPGLTDLHTHAPQYSFRALGMDLELLDWLETHAFPEEAKFSSINYADLAYTALAADIKRGPNTRICFFATSHVAATLRLMDIMESSGLVSMVGKVNMDRNAPDAIREPDAETAASRTVAWLEQCAAYKNTRPILTPRFIPSCTDALMHKLGEIQKRYGLPVQSHLSENQKEVAWVRELCPDSRFYGDAYARFGLFGGDAPTVMAHCVWSGEAETRLLQERGVYVAHCPQSNSNLSSGIAPIRRFMDAGVALGLGSDVAGGAHASIFRAMTDAIQVSKLRQCLIDQTQAALSLEEAFYMGTLGGGSFFGKVGSFALGYELDALVIDDQNLAPPFALSVRERLERVVYLSDDRNILAKYVRGKRLF